MNKYVFVVTLVLVVLVIAPASSDADAGQPSRAMRATETLVHKQLLIRLANKERHRSKFTRARLPPRQRRVRALDAEPLKDLRGKRFVRFEIDELRGSLGEHWTTAVYTGCVYLGAGDIYIKMGDELRPSDMLLGKYRKAAGKNVCVSAERLSRR